MGRDVSMAFCFGSAPEVAAFMVAYRLANLFRRLFGEGNLQAGFIPHFEKLRLEEKGEAACFYRDFFYSLVLLLVGLVLFGALLCGGFYWFIPSDIVFMSLAMLPGVAFLCFYALEMSVLQCWQSYFLPSFAPALFNLVWILSAFFLRNNHLRSAMFGLSFCLVAGFFVQWAFLSWAVQRKMAPLFQEKKRRVHFFSPQVRTLFRPMAFGLVGVGAAQLNSAFDAIFARFADLSGPAYLWYAIRIQQLPLSLFGIALSGALLPPLSRAFQLGQIDRFRALFETGLRRGVVLTIPCAVGMVVLGIPGLDLLYGHGHFLLKDVVETGRCLAGYAFGLVPMTCTLFFANALYAKKEYAWPMRCSLVSVGLNLVLNSFFIFGFGWGAQSVAWATSLSALLNCSLLARRVEISVWRKQGFVAFCSGLAALITWPVTQMCLDDRHFSMQMFRFLGSGGVYIGAFMALAYLMKIEEFLELFGMKRASLSNDSEA